MNVFNDQSAEINFYTKSPSRNGSKVAIVLEELGLNFDLRLLHTLLIPSPQVALPLSQSRYRRECSPGALVPRSQPQRSPSSADRHPPQRQQGSAVRTWVHHAVSG